MANEKHIFIGIGGQGVKTVAKIKSKVYEKRFPTATSSKTRLQAMNDNYRFIFIDTDQRDIDNANRDNRSSFENGNVPFINPQTDLINLGKANPSAIYYEAKRESASLINKRILEACSPELATKIPDQPLSFGAGAFRIKSRIAFAHSLADFQSKLQSAISSLNDVKTIGGEDCVIYYWLVSSSLGGTGSGIFNDVLYHINQLHHQIVGNGDPQLVYTLYMPKVFIDANSTEEKYSLNAYGVFSELEAFKKMSYDEKQNTVMHRLAFNNDYNLVDSKKRYCPFYYVIPVDIQTDKGTSLGSPGTMIQNTAEMLYHLHNGQAGATFRSDIDNYMNDIMEKNHEEFLVPMGYVSLQKPIEQYNKYMRARFKRDILRSWLLCSDKKQATVSKEDVDKIAAKLFKELNDKEPHTIAHKLVAEQSAAITELIDGIDVESKVMDDRYKFDNINNDLDSLKTAMANAGKDEKKNETKKVIVNQIWQDAEELIRNHGLAYAHAAIKAVREKLNKELQPKGNSATQDEGVSDQKVREASTDAETIDFKEKIGLKNNADDIREYKSLVSQYADEVITAEVKKWADEIKRDFVMDEHNDELSKLARYIQGIMSKAQEMNADAVKEYNKLATKFGEAALDVTTVYLPMLKNICDGYGWKAGNFFSKQYTKVISASEDETPERDDLKRLVNNSLYSYNEENLSKRQVDLINQYKLTVANADDDKKTVEIRFFANQNIADQGNVKAEKVINDFLQLAEISFEKILQQDKSIQEGWYNKKIYSFFSELTNDEKDDVRRSLNPALFFSYNNNRIAVTKKEEHIIFVTASEDLAEEMLGYQKGNNKHRFEKGEDENSAMVLKSKFGLALRDYRIYDAIKNVYDHATFRQKYHFHGDFAQHLDKLTIDHLPLEVLPQHHSYVKMLMLNELRKELSPLFYQDEYDKELYIDTMYIQDSEVSEKIALPKALITDGAKTDGKLAICTEADGRALFHTIEGNTFVERFETYIDLYHNDRFGETTDRLIQAIIRSRVPGETPIRGEEILKQNYAAKRKNLLDTLNKKKSDAPTLEERRIYSIFFNLLRNDYASVNDFKK